MHMSCRQWRPRRMSLSRRKAIPQPPSHSRSSSGVCSNKRETNHAFGCSWLLGQSALKSSPASCAHCRSRFYDKLAGMTGTAAPAAAELFELYGLKVSEWLAAAWYTCTLCMPASRQFLTQLCHLWPGDTPSCSLSLKSPTYGAHLQRWHP